MGRGDEQDGFFKDGIWYGYQTEYNIPRDENGRKMDWELDLDDLEDAIIGEQLEEHIAKLLREQMKDD